MAELIQSYQTHVQRNGVRYSVQAYGERQGHVWYGWLEFVPTGQGLSFRTPRETTQPTRKALAYWASGLKPIYVEGAFARALHQQQISEALIHEVEQYLRHVRRGGLGG